MKPRYYIQQNLRTEDEQKQFTHAIQKAGGEPILVTVIPFSDALELPNYDPEELNVCLGSTTMIKLASQDPRYAQSVCNPDGAFSSDEDIRMFGDQCLNFDCWVGLLKDWSLSDGMTQNSLVFVKGTEDDKQMTGSVMTCNQLLDYAKQTNEHFNHLGLIRPDMRIQVSSVKNILAEYRLIVVGDYIAGASQYRPTRDASVPKRVLEYARQQMPKAAYDMYALDIAEVQMEDGSVQFRIVETNCFNASGLYKCDLRRLFKRVNQFLMQKAQL